jgi:3',5'-cyclic AMP phosphodiesterase CpdA
VTAVTIAHVSDLHFGRDVSLTQVEALEAQLPELRPDAIVLSGDVSQRARHGELQMARFFRDRVGKVAPVLTIPGNHDVQWWASPFGVRGTAPMYRKYRRYFGPILTPHFEIPGACFNSVLTSHGMAFGSMTWDLNDLAVKGHLPRSEVARVTGYFRDAAPGVVRVLVVHHNVLRGEISRRMGLAHWREAQQRLRATGADLILCGHDHQESSGQIDGTVVVSTTGTLTSRTRGQRASAFNLITVDDEAITVQHLRWEEALKRFKSSDQARYGRMRTRSGE